MKTSASPPIDIILVNFNGMAYLPACLDSIFKSEYPFFTVIVVDNCSTDGSVDWIKKNYPGIVLIENRKNKGFGSANSQGIERGDAPYFALLNNDTIVDKNWLNPLVETLKADADCGAVCSKLVFMDSPKLINAAGGGMNIVGYGYDHDMFTPVDQSSGDVKNVFFPTAAACLFRRRTFDAAGGFDPAFFMYHEDVDLGWRLNLMGSCVKYVPGSVVHHAFGGTTMNSGGMLMRNRLGLRHALRSLLKNYELDSLKKILPVFLKLGMGNFLGGIPTGFFRALQWNLIMLPDTIIKRAKVQRTRKLSDKDLNGLMWQGVDVPVKFPES